MSCWAFFSWPDFDRGAILLQEGGCVWEKQFLFLSAQFGFNDVMYVIMCRHCWNCLPPPGMVWVCWEVPSATSVFGPTDFHNCKERSCETLGSVLVFHLFRTWRMFLWQDIASFTKEQTLSISSHLLYYYYYYYFLSIWHSVCFVLTPPLFPTF